jgi:hypothetical protein
VVGVPLLQQHDARAIARVAERRTFLGGEAVDVAGRRGVLGPLPQQVSSALLARAEIPVDGLDVAELFEKR